jgi:hypothetical protein
MLADVQDLVRLLRRIAVTVAGTVILAVGVVLLVAPGPGPVATASAALFGVGALGLSAVLVLTDFLPFSGVATGVSVAIGGLTVLATMAYGVQELRRTENTEADEDAG